MEKSVQLLCDYLNIVLRDPSKANINIEELEDELLPLARQLISFAHKIGETKDFMNSLAKGDLDATTPSRDNELSAPLKSLHANFRHLTWQSEQVAKGDYSQKVNFMGKFSDSFNSMVTQLAERERVLAEELEEIQKQALAIEHSKLFFMNLTQNMPQAIIVADTHTKEILFINDIAKNKNKNYINEILSVAINREHEEMGRNLELELEDGTYLQVDYYPLEWNNLNSTAFVINDVTKEKNETKQLEEKAYRDAMTGLYNRYFGMRALDKYLHERKTFSLVFTDLDGLKYVNDVFGHNEGDKYINTVAKYLKWLSHENIVARIGGDEFLIIMPKKTQEEAEAVMQTAYDLIASDEYLNDKEFTYSISFGVVGVDSHNTLSEGDILSLADERMYENKRARKKERQINTKTL